MKTMKTACQESGSSNVDEKANVKKAIKNAMIALPGRPLPTSRAQDF